MQGKSVTFIKSGQALALRPDIVKSPEYIRELQKLQDEVGTFDSNVAMEIITEELGLPAQDLYVFDPPIPIERHIWLNWNGKCSSCIYSRKESKKDTPFQGVC